MDKVAKNHFRSRVGDGSSRPSASSRGESRPQGNFPTFIKKTNNKILWLSLASFTLAGLFAIISILTEESSILPKLAGTAFALALALLADYFALVLVDFQKKYNLILAGIVILFNCIWSVFAIFATWAPITELFCGQPPDISPLTEYFDEFSNDETPFTTYYACLQDMTLNLTKFFGTIVSLMLVAFTFAKFLSIKKGSKSLAILKYSSIFFITGAEIFFLLFLFIEDYSVKWRQLAVSGIFAELAILFGLFTIAFACHQHRQSSRSAISQSPSLPDDPIEHYNNIPIVPTQAIPPSPDSPASDTQLVAEETVTVSSESITSADSEIPTAPSASIDSEIPTAPSMPSDSEFPPEPPLPISTSSSVKPEAVDTAPVAPNHLNNPPATPPKPQIRAEDLPLDIIMPGSPRTSILRPKSSREEAPTNSKPTKTPLSPPLQRDLAAFSDHHRADSDADIHLKPNNSPAPSSTDLFNLFRRSEGPTSHHDSNSHQDSDAHGDSQIHHGSDINSK